MPCCGRLQAEVAPLPLQPPASGEIAAAALCAEGQSVRELLEQGGAYRRMYDKQMRPDSV